MDVPVNLWPAAIAPLGVGPVLAFVLNAPLEGGLLMGIGLGVLVAHGALLSATRNR